MERRNRKTAGMVAQLVKRQTEDWKTCPWIDPSSHHVTLISNQRGFFLSSQSQCRLYFPINDQSLNSNCDAYVSGLINCTCNDPPPWVSWSVQMRFVEKAKKEKSCQ